MKRHSLVTTVGRCVGESQVARLFTVWIIPGHVFEWILDGIVEGTFSYFRTTYKVYYQSITSKTIYIHAITLRCSSVGESGLQSKQNVQ